MLTDRLKWLTRRAALVLATAAVVFAAVLGLSQLAQSHNNTVIVKAYCSGAISNAQYRGCLAHVNRARIDHLANEGDATAINAENVTCNPGDGWQDGDC